MQSILFLTINPGFHQISAREKISQKTIFDLFLRYNIWRIQIATKSQIELVLLESNSVSRILRKKRSLKGDQVRTAIITTFDVSQTLLTVEYCGGWSKKFAKWCVLVGYIHSLLVTFCLRTSSDPTQSVTKNDYKPFITPRFALAPCHFVCSLDWHNVPVSSIATRNKNYYN